MSPKRRKQPDPEVEGWEALAEEASAGSLGDNPELKEALREAAEAVDRRAEEAQGSELDASGEVLLTEPVGVDFADDETGRVEAELVETKDKLLRLQADFENFRRRALKERQEALQYGHQNLVKDLLSTVDNLDRAIDHAQRNDGGDLDNLLQGVELVRRELLGVLSDHGVEPIDALGKPFDPALHEAMSQVADESVPQNTVVEVLQKGYQIRDRLLRPSRVVVAKASDKASESGEGGATD